MRFLSMIRINEKGGQVPSEQLMDDMGKLIAEMARVGVLVRTAGLRLTSEGTRVRLRQGQLSTVDGPFAETKEVVGGFAILEAESTQKAIRARVLTQPSTQPRGITLCARKPFSHRDTQARDTPVWWRVANASDSASGGPCDVMRLKPVDSCASPHALPPHGAMVAFR